MPIYSYKCSCGLAFDDYNTVEDRATSPCACGDIANKDLEASLPTGKGIILNNALVTDFGDGSGTQTYTRRQYRDKCKELDKSPDGLLF